MENLGAARLAGGEREGELRPPAAAAARPCCPPRSAPLRAAPRPAGQSKPPDLAVVIFELCFWSAQRICCG